MYQATDQHGIQPSHQLISKDYAYPKVAWHLRLRKRSNKHPRCLCAYLYLYTWKLFPHELSTQEAGFTCRPPLCQSPHSGWDMARDAPCISLPVRPCFSHHVLCTGLCKFVVLATPAQGIGTSSQLCPRLRRQMLQRCPEHNTKFDSCL